MALFALCAGEWESWAALLGAPLHASVFGKDGAVWESMERSHGPTPCLGNVSLGDEFTPCSL